MSLSDADHLEQLKLARDAITAGLLEGAPVVEYWIRGRKCRREPTKELLDTIESQIETYESKSARSSASILRPVAFSRVSRRGA